MENIEQLYKSFDEIYSYGNIDLTNENANTDGASPVGQIGLVASVSNKQYAMRMLDEDVREAFKDGYIHIHDFDWYATGSTTCCQIPLDKLLKNGFTVGECYIRQPQTISTAMTLAGIILQSNQNMHHGGQAYANFDFDLAPYVHKSYEKHYNNIMEVVRLTAYGEISYDEVEALAWERTVKETYQACEAFVHNMNSLLCRNGSQVPFTSLNFGLDTSKEGRLITEQILLATEAGLGNGETPIFPILIFKMKKGINYNPEDPNYDLYKLALKTTSKRLFPNFVNCDVAFNKNTTGDLRNEISTMGCRTRVFNDVNGINTPVGRGNLSFTTLNLPMIAHISEDVDDFFFNLDHYIDLALKQLRKRYEYQRTIKAGNFKFLYGNNVWKGSEDLKPQDQIGDVLNTGTLALGFIGLAEALVDLIGEHHGESEEAWQLGYNIVKHMKERTDEATAKEHLNYGVIATPAEGYAGKSLRQFKAKFGVIEGVSDREYFTNSNHIPVYYNIKAIDKIKKEAPFHELTLGGHICYIELDGDVAKNLEAMDKIVKTMMEEGVGYGAINHPVDRCRECNHKGVIDEDTCPVCGSDNISRVRRITGYLVGSMERWNSGKRAEESERVKHGR